MGIVNSAPCQGCEDRHSGCHGKCKKYKFWKDEWQKKKTALNGDQARERMLNGFYADGCIKAIKKNGGKI